LLQERLHAGSGISCEARRVKTGENWGPYMRTFRRAYWLRHYATRLKITGSRTDEVIFFPPIYLILPATLSPGVYSASNRNEYQKQINNVSGV
jgi:hypothetical protein